MGCLQTQVIKCFGLPHVYPQTQAQQIGVLTSLYGFPVQIMMHTHTALNQKALAHPSLTAKSSDLELAS